MRASRAVRLRSFLAFGIWNLAFAFGLWPLAAAANQPLEITAIDEGGIKGQTGAPAAIAITLPEPFLAAAKAGRLTLCDPAPGSKPFPAQFDPDPADPAKGTLWWLMPPGLKGERRFVVGSSPDAPASPLTVALDPATQAVDIAEGSRPVLRYHFGTVPVPPAAKGRYAVARSDYIDPLYGPNGEVLTRDYPPEHPHHRGLYWAWPEVAWKGETLDLHALQGVFARPVKLLRTEGGPVAAVIVAENKWMWHDQSPIVREIATLRAFAEKGGSRFVDLEFQFTALVDGVTIARRGQSAYGGFNCRFSPRKDQKITSYNAPAGAPIPASWGQIVGVPPDGKEPIGVAILQNAANPCYPGDWVTYPNLNWLQPTFPSKGEKFPLSTTAPLVLRFRLWIHPGAANEQTLIEQWRAYNGPAK